MFPNLKSLPLDPIFGVMAQWRADGRKEKVNLGIGIYRDSQGNPFVMESVKKAIKELDSDNFEYELMWGHQKFLKQSAELFLGKNFIQEEWVLQQGAGGTHSCKILDELCQRALGEYTLLCPTPTWPNHYGIFKPSKWVEFPHLKEDQSVNIEAYEKAIRENPGTIILLQGGPTHNPTGLNLSLDQWREVAELCKKSGVKILVDFAYLGLGDGLQEDRACLGALYQADCDFAFAISYSKNASLYSERVGGAFIRVRSEEEKKIIESQTYRIIRESLSCLPQYGAKIMNKIFDQCKSEWLAEVEAMRQDIAHRQKTLLSILPEHFGSLKNCRGMFGLLPLPLETILKLREDHGIYLLDNGRINFAGLRDQDTEVLKPIFKKL